MIEEKDFSHLSRFPGETGNPFDIVLHRLDGVQKIHPLFFFLILAALSLLSAFMNWPAASLLLAFMLSDWLALELLPKLGKSFGPPLPPALILAVLRAFFAFLLPPLPWGWLLQVVGSLLVIYAFWIEPHHLVLTRQRLSSPKLRAGQHLRILHLGDLHIERITARENAVQTYIEQLKPDLILFSGDILNLSYRTDPTAIEHARQVMGRWRAPLGVFAVSGSPAVDLPEVFPSVLAGLGIQRLDNRIAQLDTPAGAIHLVGMTCSHRPHVDGPILSHLVAGQTADTFTVFLYHSPDLAPTAARLGIDLQLSGHTHGGQVCLPFFGALFTGSLYGKAFEAGRIAVGKMILYVTRGIGLEGAAAPRLRLFCPPEIILWDVEGMS